MVETIGKSRVVGSNTPNLANLHARYDSFKADMTILLSRIVDPQLHDLAVHVDNEYNLLHEAALLMDNVLARLDALENPHLITDTGEAPSNVNNMGVTRQE